MAYKLIWSPAARDDLHDIVVFIARSNPNRAMSFGYELISETDRLQQFPELGRIVLEYRNNYIREIIFRPYRIVYGIIHEEKLCEITAFGIQREEFQSCKSGHSELSSHYDHQNQARQC
jgi:plasmid stabilization system protein ParE